MLGRLSDGHLHPGWKPTLRSLESLICDLKSAHLRPRGDLGRLVGTAKAGSAALHLHGETSLGALIEDYSQSSGGVHYADVTGIAKFYYEPTGSKSWRYLGESRATSAHPGSVAVEPGGMLDGKFEIISAAQGDFLGSSGTQTLP